MRPNQPVETFPDGIVEVHTEANRTIGDFVIAKLRFEEQSVGVRRYYESQSSAEGNRIDRVIKVPHTKLVNRMNIAIMITEDERQYRIVRIQEKPERNVDLWELQSVQIKYRPKPVEPTPDPTPGPSPDPTPDPAPEPTPVPVEPIGQG